MILGTPRMVSNMGELNVNVILDSTALEKVKHSKWLGVLIEDCFTWKNHIDCVSKTISRNIGVMNKLEHLVPTRILHVLYCTLVLPYLNYGIIIWGDTCKSYLDKLIKLQKWAIRIVCNSHYRSRRHTGPIFAKYNVLTVTDIHTLELGTFMYRNSVSELSSSFNNYFTKWSEVHNYLTRHGNHLSLTKNKKTFSDHSVCTTGPRLWNALENSTRASKSVKHFRNQMIKAKAYFKLWIIDLIWALSLSCKVVVPFVCFLNLVSLYCLFWN